MFVNKIYNIIFSERERYIFAARIACDSGPTCFTMHALDGRTDGQTDKQNSHHYTASAFHAAR